MTLASFIPPIVEIDWSLIVGRLCATAQMLIVFAAAASIPVSVFYFRYRAKRELTKAWHEQRLAAIEKGVELPPIPEALVNGSHRDKPPAPADWSRWSLLVALICLGGGLGVLMSFGGGNPEMSHDRAMRDFAHLGGATAMLGLALFIFWLMAGRKKRPADAGVSS